MDTVERIDLPPHRRTSFEVESWDGLRWVLEGAFETGVEAAAAAKRVLEHRLGVKVTEEGFSNAEGIFKSSVVFTEYRDDAPKPQHHPVPTPVIARDRHRERYLASTDAVLYVAISALVVSIISMIFSVAR